MCSSAGGRQQIFHAVGALPGKEIDFLAIVLAGLGLTPKVPVAGSRPINGALEFQCVNNALRGEVKDLLYHLLEHLVGHGAGSERLYQHRDRLRHTNGVSYLTLTAPCQLGLDNVLRYPPGGVGRRSIHLGWVFAAERASAMACHASVGIYDDLASSQSRVTVRTTDNESAGRIHQKLGALVVKASFLQNGPDDFLDDRVTDGALGELPGTVSLRVLRGHHHSTHADRLIAL